MSDLNLTDLVAGEEAQIVSCIASGNLRRQLAATGVKEGLKIRKLSEFGPSRQVVFLVDQAQISIDQTTAQKIRVLRQAE